MKLKFKEDPREWRKSTWLTMGGLALMSSVLRWRHVIRLRTWETVLLVLAVIAVAAAAQPRWFRGYYRFSQRVGFHLSQFLGRIVLLVFFLLILTPLGFILRRLGKDPLRLKRPSDAKTYWQTAKETPSLDSLF